MCVMLNLAILSPEQNVYSETFIQAHKNLPYKVSFYYGGFIPNYLEGKGYLLNHLFSRICYTLDYRNSKKLSLQELALKYSLKKNGIQVVLAEYGPTAAESLAVIKSLKLPLFVYFHGYDATVKSVLSKYEIRYKDVFNYAIKIFSVSAEMTKKLIELGCPIDKIVYNVYGPNQIFFKNSPHFNNKQFVAIGRFVDKKAPYYLILAFKDLVKKYPNAQLKIAGDGVLFNSCINLIKHFKLDHNIHLVGIVTPEDWVTVLENSLAFVQHSITAYNGDMEGTPVAILEACAAALPVISTIHAGIPDIIIDGVNGYLVEEHDVEQMTKNLIKIYENADHAKDLGLKGRDLVANNFSLSKHLATIEKEINNILK